jgi:hypothetical protein
MDAGVHDDELVPLRLDPKVHVIEFFGLVLDPKVHVGEVAVSGDLADEADLDELEGHLVAGVDVLDLENAPSLLRLLVNLLLHEGLDLFGANGGGRGRAPQGPADGQQGSNQKDC